MKMPDKKILYCASTHSHILNFHLPYLKQFHQMGYQVHVACDKNHPVPYADRVIALPFAKSFFSLKNLHAAFLACQLMKKEKYDIISLHTTLASVIMRLGVFFLSQRPKVYNTVHGYLFSKTDRFFKKLPYLLPEKLCSFSTYVTMVMNQEDFDLAYQYRLHGSILLQIPGMGVDFTKYHPACPEKKRAAKEALGFLEQDFIFLYAAEFSKRKNQRLCIDAFLSLAESCPNAILLLAGDGKTARELKEKAEHSHCKNRILFPGHVTNMLDLYTACDVYVSTSKSEGLPFNIMEAMGMGLPVIATKIKGHTDLITDGATGLLTPLGEPEALTQAMKRLIDTPFLRTALGNAAAESLGPFSIAQAEKKIMEIYQDT